MTYRISDEAQRDLAGIAQHIAKDNPARARSFIRELNAKIRKVAVAARRKSKLRTDAALRRRPWCPPRNGKTAFEGLQFATYLAHEPVTTQPAHFAVRC